MLSLIFQKIAEGKPLSPVEQAEFTALGDRLHLGLASVEAWTKPPYSVNNPYFQQMSAHSGNFQFVPSEGLLITTGTFGIANDTQTNIQSINLVETSNAFSCEVSTGKIRFADTSNVIGVIGNVNFTSGGSGIRQVRLTFYDQDDNDQNEDMLLSEASGTGAEPETFSFAFPYLPNELGSFPNLYAKFSIYQNSGGSLGVHLRASLFVLR